MLPPRTLTRDLVLSLTTTIVVVLTVSGLLFYLFSQRQHATELARQADVMSTELAALLAEPLWVVDQEGAAQIGRLYAARPDVAYLRIVDENGQTVFEHTGPAPEAAASLQRTRPIRYGEHDLGTVTLALSLTRLQAENRAVLVTLLLAGLLLLTTVFGVILWLSRRFLHRPLTLLTDNLHRIAEGDYSHSMSPRGLADLDAIIGAVNTMVAALRERDARLRRSNEELEERVRQRTQRLQQTNRQLQQEIEERRRAEQARDQLIRELEQKNRELQEKNAALEAANAELERFTYTVSHDLKTPLVTIKGFLGLIEQDVLAGEIDRFRKDLQRVDSATDRLHQLLEDLLELSRVGRLMNPPEAVPLHEPLQRALDLTTGALTRRHVTVDVPPALPTVWGDPERLVEVFQNLLDNAVKFMGDQPAPRIEVRATVSNGAIHCSVRDNGIGIPPAYQEKIFGLFERLEADVEGTGVGLAVVKRIIELHGGRIWVTSEGPGHGACFHFTLPPPPASAATPDRAAVEEG